MNKWNKIHLALVSLVLTSGIEAQESSEEGRIKVGQFDVIPSLTTSMSYVDNVAYANEDDPKIYSWRSILSPEIVAATEVAGNPIQVGYRLDRGVYFSSSSDDYTDHFLEASADVEINARNAVNLKGQFEDGHEERGTGFSLGGGNNLTSPDRYKSSYIGADYFYGAVTSDGRIKFKADRQTLDYDRSEQRYLIRDRVSTNVGAEFFYQVGASTSLVLDLVKSSVRYDNQTGIVSRDSDESRVLVGLTWEGSAATTGFAKIGYKEKDFKAESRDTFYGTDWEVGIEWQPLSYSTFVFSTSADTLETNGEGNFIRGRNYSLSWEHEWLERLSSSIRVAKSDDEYISDGGLDNRDDDLMNYSATLNYSARRWLSFALFYRIQDRTSNRELIGYDRNVVGVSAEVSL